MTPPPDNVREAFGAVGQPMALSGGRGLAWPVDDAATVRRYQGAVDLAAERVIRST
jgi:hypothetical protein